MDPAGYSKAPSRFSQLASLFASLFARLFAMLLHCKLRGRTVCGNLQLVNNLQNDVAMFTFAHFHV